MIIYILRIQKEYKELLISLLPKLKSGFAPEALDEINIFWLRNIDIVQLYMRYVVPDNSYVFTAVSFLDFDDHEYIPFLMIGNNHIFDDPLCRYSELGAKLPEGKDAKLIYEQIIKAAEDNLKILENPETGMIVIPLLLFSDSTSNDIVFQKGEQIFLGLFNGVESLEDYYDKCENIDEIINYACNDIEKIVMFSETDEQSLPFKERFLQEVVDAEFMIDSKESDALKFFSLVYGYIHQAVGIIAYCLEYGCIPYIRNPVALHYLLIVSSCFANSSWHNEFVFKTTIAFIFHKTCDKKRLSEVGIKELIEKTRLYGLEKNIFDKFNLDSIANGRDQGPSAQSIINAELELFYKFLSTES